MNLRQLALVQLVLQLWQKLFGSQSVEPVPVEEESVEAAPRMLTARDIQSRLAAKNIPLRSTLRVLWIRPSSGEGEWEIFHPFSKAPLSVYEDQLHTAEVAVALLRMEGGGMVALLDVEGDVLNEVDVPPLGAEDTPAA